MSEYPGVDPLAMAGPYRFPAGATCETCRESLVEGERLMPHATFAVPWGGVGYMHYECVLLGIVGHDFGVCSCHDFDTNSRTSARELMVRMEAAGGLG